MARSHYQFSLKDKIQSIMFPPDLNFGTGCFGKKVKDMKLQSELVLLDGKGGAATLSFANSQIKGARRDIKHFSTQKSCRV